jgi:small-conductance mechanosensitive channel
MNGPNGASLSYPNKRIFETPVKNHSKMNNWIYISVDFFFDVTTDIALAKEKLKEAM